MLLAFVGVAVVGGVASYVVGSIVGHDAVRQGLRLGAGRGRGAATLPPEATTAFDEALSDALLWGVAAAILAGVVVAMVLSRHLARPVEAMQEGARKLAGGDFSVRVPVHGPVEISGLGDDINHLAGTLQAIEERARSELGMMHKDDVYYQVIENSADERSQEPATPAQ